MTNGERTQHPSRAARRPCGTRRPAASAASTAVSRSNSPTTVARSPASEAPRTTRSVRATPARRHSASTTTRTTAPAHEPDAATYRRHLRGSRLGHGDPRSRRSGEDRDEHGGGASIAAAAAEQPPARRLLRSHPQGSRHEVLLGTLAGRPASSGSTNSSAMSCHTTPDMEHTACGVFLGKSHTRTASWAHPYQGVANDPDRTHRHRPPHHRVGRDRRHPLGSVPAVTPGSRRDAQDSSPKIRTAYLAERANRLDELEAMLAIVDLPSGPTSRRAARPDPPPP